MNSENIKTCVKAYVIENKSFCLKAAATALVIIIALIICLSNNLKDDDEILIVGTGAGEPVSEQQSSARGAGETGSGQGGSAAGAGAEGDTETVESETLIIVDIEGAVASPGIVKLPDGSRVNDAIDMAGGLTAGADTMFVNLAAKLADGDKLYIPMENEKVSQQRGSDKPSGIVTDQVASAPASSPGAGDAGNGASESGPVNINTATSEQLQTLKGVGPATAQKIIEYRESSGGFKKIEDIMKVKGIGTKTFERWKDNIAV